MGTNVLLLVVAAVIYGAIFPVNRLAAEAAWPPVAFALFQVVLGGLVLGAAERLRGNRLVPSLAHVRSYLVLGALAMALPTAVLALTARHVPAVVLTLVLALSPVLTMTFATMLRLEPFRPRLALAVALGFAGVVLIASPWSHALGAGEAGWFLLALLAPVMFAAANVSASLLRPPATGSATMTAGMLLGGGLVVLPVALLAGPLLPPAADAPTLGTLAAGAAINTAVMVLFFEIVRRAGPTFFSLFNYIALSAGVIWSIALFGEMPRPMFWLALAIMLGAVGVAIGGRRPATA